MSELDDPLEIQAQFWRAGDGDLTEVIKNLRHVEERLTADFTRIREAVGLPVYSTVGDVLAEIDRLKREKT